MGGIVLEGPNDLVFDAEGGLCFTDLGKVRERDMGRGAVFHTQPDGRTLHCAETEGARLWALAVTGPGLVDKQTWPSPQGARQLVASPGGHCQRFDSMAVDACGNLLVATLLHGGTSVISPAGRLCMHVPLPDRCVTSLCFGGPELRRLFVTLSGVGKLIAIDDWPVPGLALHFDA